MPPALELALVVLLIAVSAAAGALWWRGRAAWPIGELAERLRAVEATLSRIEAARRGPASRVAPWPTRRVDRGQPEAVAGPTLIAVPDLSAPAGEPSAAAAELGRRFGAIWDLADAGAPPEAIARRTGQP